MSDFTPTTPMIRTGYMRDGRERKQRADDFDRWLDNIRAEAWGEGFDVGATHGIAYQAGDDNALPQPSTLNPYRKDRA